MDPKHLNEGDILDRAIRALRETAVPEELPTPELDRLLAHAQDPIQPAVRPVPDVPTELADGVRRETHPIKPPPSRRHDRGRFLMMFQHRSVRWAMAAAAAAAALAIVGFWPSGKGGKPGPGVAFADVIQYIQRARTVSYAVTEEAEGRPAKTMKIFISEPDRMRMEMTIPMPPDGRRETLITVYSIRQAKSLHLNPSRREADLLELSDTSLEAALKNANLDSWVTLQTIRDFSKVKAVPLGEQVVSGRRAVGFRLDDPAQKETTSLWADAQTGQPIRVERSKVCQLSGAAFVSVSTGPDEPASENSSAMPTIIVNQGRQPQEITVKQVITDITFDQELDESLFSLDPPAGYRARTINPITIDATQAAEQDLIDGLRAGAEMRDGEFSDDLMDIATYMRVASEGQDGTARKPIDLMHKFAPLARASSYMQQSQAMGFSCHIFGAGVKLGDATRPICLIGKPDAPTVRVIYGDLSVRELSVQSEEWKAIQESLLKRERDAEAQRGWLGVVHNHDASRERGLEGYRVDEVTAGSPADKAGLRQGDIVIGCNGQGIQTCSEFGRFLRNSKAGENVKLTIRRDQQTLSLQATLGRRP